MKSLPLPLSLIPCVFLQCHAVCVRIISMAVQHHLVYYVMYMCVCMFMSETTTEHALKFSFILLIFNSLLQAFHTPQKSLPAKPETEKLEVSYSTLVDFWHFRENTNNNKKKITPNHIPKCCSWILCTHAFSILNLSLELIYSELYVCVLCLSVCFGTNDVSVSQVDTEELCATSEEPK